MQRLYNSKYVEVTSSSELSSQELYTALDLVLSLLGKEVVRTIYNSHGDNPQTEITLEDIGKTESGSFDANGKKE